MRIRRRRFMLLALAAVATISVCLSASASADLDYRIDLDVDWDAGTFAGTLDLTFANPGDAPIDRVALNLFANDATLYGAASLRVLDAAIGETPLPLPVQTEPTWLALPLPAALSPGQTATLVLRFVGEAAPSPATASAARSGYGILTKNADSFVLTAFYPILAVDGAPVAPSCGIGDRLWGDAADYTVTLRTSPGLSVASTGTLQSSSRDVDRATHVLHAESARDFSLVLLDDYELAELQSGSRTLLAHFTPFDREAAARALEIGFEAFDLYESRVGDLPYREVEIVEVPLQRVAGVEFTGLILVSETYAQNPYSTFFDIIVSHEMAHQWFYATVGNDPYDAPWLDESMATFFSNVYLAAHRSSTSALSERARWVQSYGAAQRGAQELSLGDSSCAFPSSSTYSAFVYDGGALFLQTVRNEIGDDAFFGALASYYSSHLARIASADALLAAFESACACDLDEVFREFGFREE